MSKSNIEQLISDKLQSLSFDFKSEYWDKMNEKLDADCAKTNTCSAASMGVFLSASLLIVFFAIISVIVFSPWGINKCFDTNNSNSMEISIDMDVNPVHNSVKSNNQQIAKQENEIIEVKPIVKKKAICVSKNPNVSKARRHRKVSSSKIKKSSNSTTHKTIPKNDHANLDTSIMPSENADTSSKNIMVTKDLSINSKQDKTEIEQGITTDTLTTDTDYFYESELGNKPDENEKKEVKVKVQKKPVPVKHVKTRSKPIKRVFKKKRGLLYRLGIRK